MPKYVLFCENNSSMIILEKNGDRMAAFTLEDGPTQFSYEEAQDYLTSQGQLTSNAMQELYRPVLISEVGSLLDRDKAGWYSVDSKGLREWGIANGFDDLSALRDTFPQLMALAKLGRHREAALLLESIKAS